LRECTAEYLVFILKGSQGNECLRCLAIDYVIRNTNEFVNLGESIILFL